MRCSHSLSLAGLLVVFAGSCYAQEAEKAPSAEKPKGVIPEVPEEPKTVDPATILPELVTKKGTVTFEEASLLDVAKWLREEMKIPVVFEEQTIKFSLEFGPTVTDRLDDAPVYQLLNRLSILGLRWNVSDGVLYLVGDEEARKRLVTIPYNLGDLLDAGYTADSLQRTIQLTIRGDQGEHFDLNNKGNSSLVWLGDVLFVRHTHSLQRQVQGLFTTLRKHGRRTFIYDPLVHEQLRAALEQRITVDYEKIPLTQAIDDLAVKSGADIRFDAAALKKFGNTLRTPVSLQLTDQKLMTVLRALFREFELSVIIEDGVIVLTTVEQAERQYKTAVYFVKDLCQTQEETFALMQAIIQQTQGEAKWLTESSSPSNAAGGVIVFARVGTMVVRQWEKTHWQIESLLESYRAALRQSKPRTIPGSDPKEVIVRYYKMHTVVANDLIKWLPKLIEPESWNSAEEPKAPGEIQQLASSPGRATIVGGEADQDGEPVYIPAVSKSVLIITQRREIHEKLEKLIRRIQKGDQPEMGGFGGGGQGGGGGFGQGFFSLPPERGIRHSRPAE